MKKRLKFLFRQRKLCLFVALMAMATTDVNAQFNTNYAYTLSGVAQATAPVDIIPAGKGTYWVLGEDNLGNPSRDILIKKMDVTGATLIDKQYRYKTTAGMSPYKMVQTVDSGVIVIGYLSDQSIGYNFTNPFAAKFDKSGVFQWLHVYYSNPKTSKGGGLVANFDRPNIVAAKDMTGEYYIISCMGYADSTLTSPLNEATYINALEIDGNGVLMWNKKYEISNGDAGALYQTASSALTFATNNGKNNSYFISGVTAEDPVGSPAIWYLFTLGIDHNGNVLHNYAQYYIPEYTFGHCALFDTDPNRQSIMLSYTVGNQSVAPSSTNASVIGLAQFNPVTYGLVTNNFYYVNAHVEDYCYSLAKTIQDDNYLLANMEIYASSGFTANSLLKVNATTRAPIFWSRYNQIHSTTPSYTISQLNSTGTMESYIMAYCQTYPSPSSIENLSVLGTNTTGVTCGSVSETTTEAGKIFTPTPYIDSIVSYSAWQQLSMTLLTMKITDTLCGTGHKSAEQSEITNIASVNEVIAYPTLLQQNNNITFDINSANATRINVLLYNIEGIQMAKNNFTIQAGSNSTQWVLPIYRDGNYILRIMSEDGLIQKSIRITKQ